MNDTRETIIKLGDYKEVPAKNELGHDVPVDKRPASRFKKGDILSAAYAKEEFELQNNPHWDREFGGWLVHQNFLGIHESNFILASEKDLWDPHPNILWSWWTRK